MAKYQQDPNQERLTRMYREWEQAEQRKQMAQQTLEGATAEALVREAKFKGAVDFVGGVGASWEFNSEKGHVVVTNGTVPEPASNGHARQGREVVLNGRMSPKQMQVVSGAQARHGRHRKVR